MLIVQVGRVQHGPVQIELELIVGSIAQPDRARVAVTRAVGEFFFVNLSPAVYPVERLEAAFGAAADVFYPAHEVVRLFVKPETSERIEDERRVARPGVAVVLVALPPDGFGQPHGRGGHHCSGRVVDHEFKGQRRAAHHLSPPSLVGASSYPPPPVVERVL